MHDPGQVIALEIARVQFDQENTPFLISESRGLFSYCKERKRERERERERDMGGGERERE